LKIGKKAVAQRIAPRIDYFAPSAGAVTHPQGYDLLESNFDQDFLPESEPPG
jgi:hypothetical protein